MTGTAQVIKNKTKQYKKSLSWSLYDRLYHQYGCDVVVSVVFEVP